MRLISKMKTFVDANSYEQQHWQILIRKMRPLVLLDTGRTGGGGSAHLRQSHSQNQPLLLHMASVSTLFGVNRGLRNKAEFSLRFLTNGNLFGQEGGG